MTNTASAPLPERSSASHFSIGRVALAVLLIIGVGVIVWFAPDLIAERRAKSNYNGIAGLVKDKHVGEVSYAEIHKVLKKEPTRTTDLLHGRFDEQYVFEGLHWRYIIRLEYWRFEGDEQWYFFSSQLTSEPKL